MDFRSLIQKIESVDGVIETPKAPELPKKLQLDEDIAMHVLAGTKTLTEAADLMEKKLTKAEKEKKEEVVKSMKKDKEGFKERYGKRGEEVMHATATKIAKKKAESTESEEDALNEYESKDGKYVHKGKYGSDYDGEDHKEEPKKKEKSGMTGAERRDQKAKDKEQDKASKEYEKKHGKGSVTRHKMESTEINTERFKSKFMQMVEDAKKDEKKDDKKDVKKKGGIDLAKLRAAAKTAKPVKDMTETKKPDDDNDGVPDWADKKPGEDDNADKKKSGKKGMSAKQEKYFGKKKTVKESIEPKLSFKEMIKLVHESGGQQQIDPLDKALFAWAERVAKTKFQESRKAEVYAGLVYERMGGRFEMYDVLSESLNESVLDEGMMDKIKSLIPKFMKFIGAEKAAEIANKVKSVTGGDFSANPDNAEKVAKAFGFDKIVKDKGMAKEDIMSEALAGNWQGKLVQFLYLAGLGGAAAGGAALFGTVGGSFLLIIGTLLLMFANTFFSDESGMVGAMGKRGNQGFDTDK